MNTEFKSDGHRWRLHCGVGVIEQNLADIVNRAGGRRAFVLSSPSVGRSPTIDRIQGALGNSYAGIFDRLDKDSTFGSVQLARQAAKDSGADLLVAVGGGSVLVAARAVAIFLAELGDPFQIMTQYPEGGRPFSPKLLAEKLPIVNIPTTPTSAMNRAGTGLKNDSLSHRMEYFDPKTRPFAILLDHDVLATTPFEVLRSTATTVFSGLLGALADTGQNPLVMGDQREAFRLAEHAYRLLPSEPDRPAHRRDLCLAAFLQNRAEDDGRSTIVPSTFSADYAVATALHLKFPHIGQGEATSILQLHGIRSSTSHDFAAARAVAHALGIQTGAGELAEIVQGILEGLEEIYARMGLPKRLRDLDVTPSDFPGIAAETVKNFNARTRGDDGERIAASIELLEAAW